MDEQMRDFPAFHIDSGPMLAASIEGRAEYEEYLAELYGSEAQPQEQK